MAKIITDKQKIEEVLARGVENIYPNREALEKVLMSGKKIRLYCGFDPSAPVLHIGNAIALMKLGQFQALGHEVIFLIGDFTGMIGDPTDKNAARRKLTRKEVLANAKNYKKQAGAYIKLSGVNPAKIMYNSKWSDKLSFKDLIEVTSNFTAQQMFARDMFQERIKQTKPIYLHEFLYPVAQAYD
ncbi:MAG: tyrosine--tRNA ligase, partial [Candidatus Falkowbacteria bacterium]